MAAATPPNPRRLNWTELEDLTRSLPRKTNLVIPKHAVAAPPPYRRSRLGRSRGAVRQYRDRLRHQTIHVKEYHDRFVLHVDSWNPHTNPFRHLFIDHGYKAFVHLAHLAHILDFVEEQPTPVPAPAE